MKKNVSSTVVFTFVGHKGTKVVFSIANTNGVCYEKGKSFIPSRSSKFEGFVKNIKIKNKHEVVYVERHEHRVLTEVSQNVFVKEMTPAGWSLVHNECSLLTKDSAMKISLKNAH